MEVPAGFLAQMDREHAMYNTVLNALVETYQEFRTESDESKAFFELLTAMPQLENWKLMTVLCMAVQRIAGSTPCV